MLLVCDVAEDSWESLGLQGDQPVHSKGNQFWTFVEGTEAEAEAPMLLPPDAKSWLTRKDPDAGKDWRQEKGMTGWDGWMASPTLWTWVWVNSGSWWLTGRLGMLQSMGSQRVGHDWVTELNWTEQENGTTEDEMAGWHHGLDGRESEWTPGVGDGQGGLACCDSWGHKESDTTEWLNWTELNILYNGILPAVKRSKMKLGHL